MTKPKKIKAIRLSIVLFSSIIAGIILLSCKEVGSVPMKNIEKIRKPAVAGAFYPASPSHIQSQINDFLSKVQDELDGRIMALVSPHAGYIYSGQVAAHGYKLLRNRNIKTVIVISPSHVEYFPFASVFTGSGYETPLGVIPVDRELSNRIAAGQSLVKLSDRGHMQANLGHQEHALEVQLPFLQQVLHDFTMVPIVMGDQKWEICQALGQALAPLLEEPGVVLVASSDLSHFHSDSEAKRLDAAFCNLLEAMEPEALYDGIQRKSFEACGAGPVIAALIAAKKAGAQSCRILSTATSGDVTGDTSSVVGYASAIMTSGAKSNPKSRVEKKADEFRLSGSERDYLLALARQAIAEQLGVEHSDAEPLFTSILEQKCGAFVTIKIGGHLRGCIGYIEAIKPLKNTIEEMAKAAAFHDPRFPALTRDEFESISIEISVLSPLQLVSDPGEIVVGRHGLIIEKGMNRGLLLPQVATEYNWDRLEFLAHTCQKAMLPSDAWKEKGTKIYSFTAEIFGEKEENH